MDKIVGVLSVVIVAGIVIAVLIHFVIKMIKKRKDVEGFDGVEYGVEYAVKLLAEMGCKCECVNKEKDEEDDSISYMHNFKFQGGNFAILGNSDSVYTKVVLPNVDAFNSSEVDLVRMACNLVNSNSSGIARVEYFYSDELDKLCVNVVLGMPIMSTIPSVANYLERTLAQAFFTRDTFDKAVKQIRADQEKSSISDVEMEQTRRQKEKYLICEAEVKYVGTSRSDITEDNNVVDMASLLLGNKAIIPIKLTVTDSNGGVKTIDGEAARTFILRDAIIQKNTEDAKKSSFVRKWVNVVMEYEIPEMENARKTLLLYLCAEHETERTLYSRLTVTIPGESVDNMKTVGYGSNVAKSSTALLALDKVKDEAKQAELDYMWGDMMDKANAGKFDEFTEEQHLLFGCKYPNIRRQLYFGKKYFFEGRFYEAIALLDNAYNVLVDDYHKLKPRMVEIFNEVVYMLGFSYAELRLYDKALFFLDMVAFKCDVKYDMEYINCLVNSGDHRALEVVENSLNKLGEIFRRVEDDEDGPSDALIAFRNFLARRKCYILIDKQRFDEAKELLNKMLEDPDNSDFAINELQYIDNLTSSAEKDESDGDTEDSDSSQE